MASAGLGTGVVLRGLVLLGHIQPPYRGIRKQTGPRSVRKRTLLKRSSENAVPANFGENPSLLKNSFVLSSAPGSGAEYVVFVAFRPCFRISWTADRIDDYFFNTLGCPYSIT